ncbi:uncharacterized protein LOC128211896 [Mya arenaria]|uniref:uncharacterized protein LOC128211896 n=1 Tax=Mya arenaria TaxID=6604 RepID=UPI0022E98031|nr:uncharacterized protein LOC128211896 [Mya arenaria]
MWKYTLIFVGLVTVGLGQSLEPSSCTWHETNLKIIERLAVLETKQKFLEETISRQQHFIDDLINIVMKQWGSWSEWSACAFKCSGNDVDNGRTQTRTRLLMEDNVAMQNETERRPCNAVQYAGCEASTGPDDQYGVAYDYRDQMAQATCTALLDTGSTHVYAVRRACSNMTVPCAEVCSSLSLTCFNSLHVYNIGTPLPWGVTGKHNGRMYRYNSCAGSFCGPNFCCCRE